MITTSTGQEHVAGEWLSRAEGSLGPLALGLGVVCSGYAIFEVVSVLGFDSGRSLIGPISAVLALPVFLLAWWLARRDEALEAAVAVGTGVVGLTLVAVLSSGEPSPLWFVYPLLTLLLGVIAGVWAGPVRRQASPGDEHDRLLRHAMRVETVGDLSSMVAHQLRNRLQIMTGHAALAATEGAEEKDARFATIRNEIDGSILLLDQLLELVHPDEGVVERVDLVRLCAEFHQTARTILPSAIEFEMALPPDPIMVELEPSGLEHALLNLVINARHAIGDSGSLRLTVSCRDGVAHVELTDTGKGIAAADLPRVFEPYFTTKPRGEGTGLGLAAVRRYMRSSAGEVEVESEVGRGTTFRLEFPLTG